MFNLTVSEAHTYYVGADGWLVHNQQIKINQTVGKAAEVAVAADLRKQGYTVLAGGDPSGKGQISLKVPTMGNRVVDILAFDPQGNLVAVEVKSGGATLSKMQIAKDAQIGAGNFGLVGANGNALPKNVQDLLGADSTNPAQPLTCQLIKK